MRLISTAVDRLLHTTAVRADSRTSARAVELHERNPVVDLVVGTALFRDAFLAAVSRGHVDVPRLRAGGVNVIGLTIATRYPDLRGTLSRFHFRSLGAPRSAMDSSMALSEWLIGRIETWCAASGGSLQLIREESDLTTCLQPGGPLGIFVGVQGAHVLDGDLANVERLADLGVCMLAPAHVMDNDFVGSGTGRRRGGLSAAGRELIAELERRRIIVDLAHMSLAGIEETLGIITRPPMLSHTGLVSRAGGQRRWRRYSPASRNVPDSVVRAVGEAGGVVGIALATQLLGGETIDDAVASFRAALELAGPEGVAIGSDMDGGLRMVVDAAGLPLVTDGLLTAGVAPDLVRGVLGRNALRLLRASLDRR